MLIAARVCSSALHSTVMTFRASPLGHRGVLHVYTPHRTSKHTFTFFSSTVCKAIVYAFQLSECAYGCTPTRRL